MRRNGIIDEETYQEYLERLLEGDKEGCTEIVESLLDEDIDIEDLYTDLIQRSMYEVGELWESGDISVATEHLATSITERILTLVYPKILSSTRKGKSVIIACVANEYHQIGGRMIADIFEMAGWDSYFVGADTPIQDLLDLIEEKQPDVVGFSLAIYFNLPELLEFIEKVREEHSDVKILVGGQAFSSGGSEVLDDYENTEYISSINELKDDIA
ncbi:MAG: cobalamin B12-binding domain-containing protein [Candidatus Natronoplasma sp.]